MKFNNRNIYISPKAKIGKNVRMGDNTVVYDHVEIGDNSTICNDCILGEPLNDYYNNPKYENPALKIGENALIRSHAILYAGSTLGDYFACGHRVTIREYTKTGHHCSVGTLCDIQGFTEFGNYCRLHSHVFVAQYTRLGNFVFLYPFVVLTNDALPPSNTYQGPQIGDYTQVAANAVLFPGISIGSNCLIGANSTVTKSFGDGLLIRGVPAQVICSVYDITSKENPPNKHYPWMYNFERNMPWEGLGFDEWLRQTQNIDL